MIRCAIIYEKAMKGDRLILLRKGSILRGFWANHLDVNAHIRRTREYGWRPGRWVRT